MNIINRTKLFLALPAILILASLSFVSCLRDVDPFVAAPFQYINYTVNGVPYSFEAPMDSISSVSGGLTFVLRNKGSRIPETQDSIILVFDHIAISAGTSQHLLHFNVDQVPDNVSVSAPIFVGITECGPTGQYIGGNFSGTYTGPPPTNTPYNITCNFRIKRTF